MAIWRLPRTIAELALHHHHCSLDVGSLMIVPERADRAGATVANLREVSDERSV
jgi:hypothetical protein